MNWTFRFEGVLDAGMLRMSLEDLITKAPNWRKLGGRFRVNVCLLPTKSPREFTANLLKHICLDTED